MVKPDYWVQMEQYSALRVPRGLRSAFGFPSTGGYTAIYRQLNPDVIHVITYRGTERSALVQTSGGEPCRPGHWNDATGREVWKLTGAAAQAWVEADEERTRT
jgi:hypothetical protein